MLDINEITYDIRGAAFRVYKNLGPGLLESVYEEALTFELIRKGYDVKRQQDVPLFYEGHTLNTELRLDMLVEDQVIVELKSVEELHKVHFKQLRTYLKLTGKHLGLLINFNTDNLLDSIHRIII